MLSSVYAKYLRTIGSQSGVPKKLLQKSILFWLAYLVGLTLCFAVAQFLPRKWFNYGIGLSGALMAFYLTKWSLAKEGRHLKDISLVFEKASLFRFLAGFLVGTLLLLAMVSSLILFGGLHLQPVEQIDIASILLFNLAFIPMAFHEEVGFRAYSLQRLQVGYGLWGSQLITALAFGIYHMLFGSGWFGALVGTGTWSIVYGLSAVWSRGIALPTGIHVATNIWQALVSMKRNVPAIWTLVANSPTSESALEHTQQIGLITQLIVMGISIALLAWLIKKKPL